jgi:hypothetical protein
MRLNTSGNLLLGTTVGNSLLLDFSASTSQQNGINHVRTSPNSFTDIYGCGTSGTWQGFIRFFTSNNAAASERMRIDSDGNLLVGTTSVINSAKVGIFATNNLLALKMNGTEAVMQDFRDGAGDQCGFIYSVAASNSTSYNTSSDYRLKENAQPMSGALTKVSNLKPVTFTWKKSGAASQGFIAHELQTVVPECVTGDKDAVDADGNPKYQGIDTSFLVATLTAAIQELKAIVDAQATRITALEGN